MRIHVHTIICSKQYLVRELWNGNKATGFIKRHDRLGRSTSLSLELENSLETTAHLITWVPDPILFARQCLSIPFFPLDIVNRIATRTPVKFGNEETSWAATRVHCSKVVYYISFRLLYFVSGTKRIVLRRKLSYFVDRTHIILKEFEKVGNLKLFVNFSILALRFPVSFYERNLELLLKKFSVSKEEKLCWNVLFTKLILDILMTIQEYLKYSERHSTISKIVQDTFLKKKTLNVIES